MPKKYNLKIDPLSPDRVRRIAKQVLENGTVDRDLARESYDYFKAQVDSGADESGVSKKCMVDCLKLMQSSKDKTLKLVMEMMKRHLSEKGKTSEEIDYSNLTFEQLMDKFSDDEQK